MCCWASGLAAHNESWARWQPRAIEERVQRAAEVAILERACALAEEHGALALPRWRAELKHAGRAAAQARWRSEVAAAWRRLTTGDLPESGDADGEGADPDDLRWRLAAMQRLASSTEGAS